MRRRGTVGALAAVVAAMLVAGGVAWAASPMLAEPGPLAAVRADAAVELSEHPDGVVLAPRDAEPGGPGLVLIAGARVEPAAYAAKLERVAAAGVTVVIARPTLNFAIADTRPLDTFTRLAPRVGAWAVGGHSLGGVRACRLAADDPDAVSGLLLLGAYCADDLSRADLPVLTLSAGRDGLSTPQKIADAAPLLPPDAELATLDGATHAQFGDYGAQPGDGVPTVDDADVAAWIADELLAWAPLATG
jgi:pimeloyl-ACP methyl ester carboxylesterase